MEPEIQGDLAMKKATAGKTKPARTIAVRELSRDLARVKRLIAAAKLPEVEEGLSYGLPSLKVAGKFLARVRAPDVLVLMCALEEKEFLMQSNPEVYFETDHYKGWPAVLIRLSTIGDQELAHRLQVAWRMQAPKKVLARREGVGATRATSKRRM